MNIRNTQKQFIAENKILITESMIVEAFKNSKNKQEFLENLPGKSPEIENQFSDMALFEAIEENHFTFENGMFIPNLGSKCNGRLTLNNIYNVSENVKEFIITVDNMVEEMLYFNLSDIDKTNLITIYNEQHK